MILITLLIGLWNKFKDRNRQAGRSGRRTFPARQ
jgi:hypothetical protein